MAQMYRASEEDGIGGGGGFVMPIFKNTNWTSGIGSFLKETFDLGLFYVCVQVWLMLFMQVIAVVFPGYNNPAELSILTLTAIAILTNVVIRVFQKLFLGTTSSKHSNTEGMSRSFTAAGVPPWNDPESLTYLAGLIAEKINQRDYQQSLGSEGPWLQAHTYMGQPSRYPPEQVHTSIRPDRKTQAKRMNGNPMDLAPRPTVMTSRVSDPKKIASNDFAANYVIPPPRPFENANDYLRNYAYLPAFMGK